jgi:hypothetical protein
MEILTDTASGYKGLPEERRQKKKRKKVFRRR